MKTCDVKQTRGVKQHYGFIQRPTSHDEKIKVAKLAVKKVKKAGWDGEAFIVGSVAQDLDQPCSDVDVATCTYGTMTPEMSSKIFKIQREHLKKYGVFVDLLPACDPEGEKIEIDP